MALPTSGTIKMSQIRSELDLTGALRLGQTEARELAEKLSGTIKMSDFYGARNYMKNIGLQNIPYFEYNTDDMYNRNIIVVHFDLPAFSQTREMTIYMNYDVEEFEHGDSDRMTRRMRLFLGDTQLVETSFVVNTWTGTRWRNWEQTVNYTLPANTGGTFYVKYHHTTNDTPTRDKKIHILDTSTIELAVSGKSGDLSSIVFHTPSGDQ